ncbi:MAG: hypothetical protein EOO51_11635 [Flavobacterium sp.]|nr:MAG: hypothetical protein EOO51_11635 [Flavobacterium sp.]
MKNLFSKLFNKTKALQYPTIENLTVDSSQTPEKFQHFKSEAVEFLLGTLQSLDELEREINERYEILQAKRGSSSQVHPDESGLWQEYAKRCEEIIAPVSAKPYQQNSRSFGKPTAYEYLTYPATTYSFIMKSDSRAVVEMEYDWGVQKKEQFILKNDGNGWKIDAKKYGFPGEETWHKDEL